MWDPETLRRLNREAAEKEIQRGEEAGLETLRALLREDVLRDPLEASTVLLRWVDDLTRTGYERLDTCYRCGRKVPPGGGFEDGGGVRCFSC